MNYTPGPWTPFILDMPMAEVPSYVEKCIAAGSGAEFFFVHAEMPDGAVDVCHVGNGPRSEANARAIAAVPELIEALQDCVRVMERDLSGMDVIQPELRKARAALAKATGSAS